MTTNNAKSRKKKPWRKILYEGQDYPDTYFGEELLDGLRHNVNAQTYKFSEAVIGSFSVTQQISSVILYVCWLICVQESLVECSVLFGMTLVSATLQLTLLIGFGDSAVRGASILQTAAIYGVFGWLLSPVLRTLTETISSDTLRAMAVAVFLANVAFHDYGLQVAVVSPVISLNAALFGVVCLISRLSSPFQVFVLLSLAVNLFALWPYFRIQLQTKYPIVKIPLTLILFGCVVAFLAYLAPKLAVMYIVGHLFVSFVCPLWLIKLQPLKSTIHGPWDEAVIR